MMKGQNMSVKTVEDEASSSATSNKMPWQLQQARSLPLGEQPPDTITIQGVSKQRLLTNCFLLTWMCDLPDWHHSQSNGSSRTQQLGRSDWHAYDIESSPPKPLHRHRGSFERCLQRPSWQIKPHCNRNHVSPKKASYIGSLISTSILYYLLEVIFIIAKWIVKLDWNELQSHKSLNKW